MLNTFRGITDTAPATLYFAVHPGDPTDAGTGSAEPTTGGYARVAITANTTNMTAPATAGTDRRISNGVAITFPAPTADWSAGAAMTWGSVWDAPSGGNMLASGPLSTARTVLSGDPPPTWPVGTFLLDVG